MITPLPQILSQFNLTVRGVIHIGAYTGEEYPMYKGANIVNIVMIEADPSTFQILKNNVGPECILFQTALGNKEGTTRFYAENTCAGQGSSCLKPNEIGKNQFQMVWGKEFDVPITRLDSLTIDRTKFNLINIDVQGYELEVFKGGTETLRSIDAIYTEINKVELYEGCVLVEDLDSFLKAHGFSRGGTWCPYSPHNWGDALYIRG